MPRPLAGPVSLGLTWWIEKLGWFRGSVDAARERIRRGPPAPAHPTKLAPVTCELPSQVPVAPRRSSSSTLTTQPRVPTQGVHGRDGRAQRSHFIASPHEDRSRSSLAQPGGSHERHRSTRAGAIHRLREPARPDGGILVTQFITVRSVARSRAFYSEVLGGQVVLEENPCIVKLANSWVLMNPGGPPTPDKPDISVVSYEPGNTVSSFMNLRVADIQACYERWSSKGAEFVTPPIDRRAEIRCYMRDPDGYRSKS